MTDSIEVTDDPPLLLTGGLMTTEETLKRLRWVQRMAVKHKGKGNPYEWSEMLVETNVLAEIVDELERLRTLNEGLIGRLGAIAEAFHRCVNKMGVRCPACGAAYDVGEAK